MREVYERIVADLTEAYGLLRDAQPASGRTPEELYVSQYAAAALLARVCNWGGDHETAERYALEALKGPFAFIREEQIRRTASSGLYGSHGVHLGICTLPTCISMSAAGSTPRGSPTNSTWYATTTRRSSACRRSRRPTTTTVTRSYFTRTKWEHSVVLLTKFYDKYYDEEQDRPFGAHPGAESGASARAATRFRPNRSTTAIRPLRSNI